MNLTETQLKRWRPLLFELFVAVSLAVAYFYMVRNFFAYGDPMSFNLFTAGSEKLFRLDQPFMGSSFNGRMSGLLLTGALTDSSLIANTGNAAQLHRLINVFGLYHASWLLLFFVCIVFALRHSLFVILGVFAGLIYNFSPTSGPYFYPWDGPAMLFFTLAALFFERRKLWMMAVAICAGAFFKETVLVCALLIFFADQWKWPKRALLFGGLIAVYIVVKKFLLVHLNIIAPMFSPGDALHLRGSFGPSTFIGNAVNNFRDLFSPTLNSVIFVNAGTLVAVLVLGWQKRFLPYMIVIAAFIGGLSLFSPRPGFHEVRAFMEVLPLSVILLSVLWSEHVAAAPGPEAGTGSLWSVRPTFPLLSPIVIAVIALTTSIVTLQFYVLFEDLQPANQAHSPLGKYVYNGGKTATLETLSQLFQSGYADTELKLGINAQLEHRDAEAEARYERAIEMDTNSIFALNNLATMLATDSDAQLRDGSRAVNLARHACDLTQYHEPVLIYTLAAAYAEAGQFTDAVAAAAQARSLALERGEPDLASQNEPLVNLYKAGHPAHLQP
ncbi:MAG TPA: hypothetical protein VH280_10250 [Verrucomicrobiae bacterium]|jgi:hypothetical protein|nr:hypothetical protein [Verrucomicrobiae bacterium]